MKIRSPLKWFASSRRLLKTLERIAIAEESQAADLRRLADKVCGQIVDFHPEDLQKTGASYTKDEEQVRIQEYIALCESTLHRTPTDDEIVRFLDGQEMRL